MIKITLVKCIVTIIFIFHCPLAKAKAPRKGEVFVGMGWSLRQVAPGLADSKVSFPGVKPLQRLLINFQGGLTKKWIADITIAYGPFEAVRRTSGVAISERVKQVHVPILFRRWFLPYLSVGFGPYASYRVGSVDSQTLIGESERTSAHDVAEHGFEFAIGVDSLLPVWDLQFGLDFRSSLSLTSRPGESRSINGFLFVIKKAL